eukprot:CAMPEP_0202920136 /NCGR_PEP_ID=MMETSP1392-20130828/76701_1 /ASSEMBLY_ACC=CAM_ASM_000868 /TAXON_ID=225041 /ORGANISM="Chlamydomonas chlamydogama, Strain SAG 11-48b" /LENGTH=194 /DNA_ID=CAMNT_0049613619 /DNA_START=903 /DNA_END=1487 /DNA_ORIENTATION=-
MSAQLHFCHVVLLGHCSWLCLVPHPHALVPSRAGHHPLAVQAPVQPHRELCVVVPGAQQGGAGARHVPQLDAHVVGGRGEQRLRVGREHDAADRVPVPQQAAHLPLRRPHVPHLDALVHTSSGQQAVVVLAPVPAQHLVGMRPQHQAGGGLTQVPHPHRAVTRGGQEHVGGTRVPLRLVHAVCVSGECPEAGGL